MNQAQIDEIVACLLTRKTKFYYFRDRYALMLLSYAVGEGMSIRDLKSSRFARLLQKPILKGLMAQAPNGWLSPAALDCPWPPQPEAYLLTLGQWGETSHWRGNWQQTSRPGLNLVLHLNFTERHNRPYRKLMRGSEKHPFCCPIHPSGPAGYHTLAWARLDVDMDCGEVLIEEVQSDWLRDARDQLQYLRRLTPKRRERAMLRMYGETPITMTGLERYVDEALGPHMSLWAEAMLAATVWLCRSQIGVRRIYYHTFEAGNLLKRMDWGHPPRSLYTTMPRRFCFEHTDQPPQFLLRCKHRRVRANLRSLRSGWHLLEI